MKAINSIFKTMFVVALASAALVSCDKEDEEDEISISFKTTAGYTFMDGAVTNGDTITIGIEAETEKATDPLIHFNISESVDGGSNTSLYNEDFESVSYENDYTFIMNSTSGTEHEYTFTVTNRDGINKQTALTLTVQ